MSLVHKTKLLSICQENGQPLIISGSFKTHWKKVREAKELNIPHTRLQLCDIRAKAATDIAHDYSIEAARLMLGATVLKNKLTSTAGQPKVLKQQKWESSFYQLEK